MGLAAWWTWLLGRFADSGNFPGTEAWRARRAAAVAKHHGPTFDAYPDREFRPDLNLYVEGRDTRGRLRRQYVDLSGYSLRQINLASRKWQTGLIDRIAEARYLLEVKLDEAARGT